MSKPTAKIKLVAYGGEAAKYATPLFTPFHPKEIFMGGYTGETFNNQKANHGA